MFEDEELEADGFIIIDDEEELPEINDSIEEDEPKSPQREYRIRERVLVSRKVTDLCEWAVDKANQGQAICLLLSNERMLLDVSRKLSGVTTKGSIVIGSEARHVRGKNFDSIGIHPGIEMKLIEATGFPYTGAEMQRISDGFLRMDSNRELCRQCKEVHPDSLPYGKETGHIEWQIQYDKAGEPILDDAGDVLYVGFPELRCEKGHRWYQGEGPRRDIRGPNPILFEVHLENRNRRSVQTKDGVPDPAYTMDRWGKRPIHGMYWRQHPQGRKVNSSEQRSRGAGFYH